MGFLSYLGVFIVWIVCLTLALVGGAAAKSSEVLGGLLVAAIGFSTLISGLILSSGKGEKRSY